MRLRPDRLPPALLVLALLLAAPAGARAEVLYASPDGTYVNSCSSPQDACDAFTAATLAQSGDEIELAAGDHPAGEGPPSIGPGVTLRSAPGARARLLRSSEGPVVEVDGGTVRDVELVQLGTGPALHAQHAAVERVIARAAEPAGTAMRLLDGTVVRSSAAIAGGQAITVAFAPAGVVLRGVTAIADGDALVADGSGESVAAVTAVNTILRGDESDIRLVDGDETVTTDRSAYRPAQVTLNGGIVSAAETLTADPLLAADRVHQLAGSPTVDAGRADPGALASDVDGAARAQGAAPDIGADELDPPDPGPEPDPEPTVTATATPPPAPPATPTPLPDFSLPGVVSLGFRSTPVAGRAADLVIEVYDPDTPILGILVDLGPLGLVGHSACTTLEPRGAFEPGQPLRFTLPVVFPAPGLQRYAVEIRAGGCDGPAQTSRIERSTQVGAGALVARIAQAPPARCAGTLTPRGSSDRRVAAAVVCLINRERARRRLRPLRVNRRLVRSATRHGNDMQRRRFYSHQRPGGPTLKRRVRSARYRGDSGENLGLASGILARPDQMMRMWMRSPVHRANILQRRFRAIGVHVRARDPLGRMRGAALYTVNFGTRR